MDDFSRPVVLPPEEVKKRRVKAAERWFHTGVNGAEAAQLLAKEVRHFVSFQLIDDLSRNSGHFSYEKVSDLPDKWPFLSRLEMIRTNTLWSVLSYYYLLVSGLNNVLLSKEQTHVLVVIMSAIIQLEKNALTGKVHVGGGDEFNTINDLLAHYRKNPLVEEVTQNVVRLTNVSRTLDVFPIHFTRIVSD